MFYEKTQSVRGKKWRGLMIEKYIEVDKDYINTRGYDQDGETVGVSKYGSESQGG